MTTRLISFATGPYLDAQEHLHKSARPYFDLMFPMGVADLDDDFRRRHRELLRYSRGLGFWVWKPYLILRHLRMMGPKEILMYCDSQLGFVATPQPLFWLCRDQGGLLLFHQAREGHRNGRWTHRKLFRLMGCDEPKYWNGWQLNSAQHVMMATPRTIAFVEEWYRWNSDHEAVGDFPIQPNDFPGFRDNRHEQSILSIMAIRDGITTWPDCNEFGRGYEQAGRCYGQVLKTIKNVTPPYKMPNYEPDDEPCLP